jgi:hypothetical protein
MKYYILDCEAHPYNRVAGYPDVRPANWMGGRRFENAIPEPLVFELDPDHPGVMRELYVSRIPLMRDDLVAALREAGVDNLDTYAALVRDPSTGEEHNNYKAVNIVGAIACLDRDRSAMIPGMESDMIDAGMESVVIDEAKAGDALFFRLAESVNAIVVHERVKNLLQARGFNNLIFIDPAEWSG